MKTNFNIQKNIRNSRSIGLIVAALLIGCMQAWGTCTTIATRTFGTSDWTVNHTVYTDTWSDLNCDFYGAGNNSRSFNYARLAVKGCTTKNCTATSTETCYIRYNTAIANSVSKVIINHAGTTDAIGTNLTVNWVALSVYNGSTKIDTVTITSLSLSKNVAGTFEFTPTSGDSWASGYKYYFYANITSKGNTNRGLNVSSFQFDNCESCANSVTIQKGTETNCTFTLGTNGSQASCSGVSTTVTVSPNTGYQSPVVTQSGASAAPTITGSGTSWTVTYAANTTGTSTINVSCSAKQCTVTFDKNGGTDGTNSVTATYGSAMPSITPPTREHYTFDGYYDSESDNNGTGNKYYNSDGSSAATWNKNTTSNTTLYAKWTEHGFTNYRTLCDDSQCATPTFSPVTGTMLTPDNNTVTISCATDGATIYYTTNGSTPTSSSTEYTGALSFDAGVTINAIAIKDGLDDSEVATATYTFGRQFELATSSTELVEGDEIVIMEENSVYAMGAQTNTNYRDRTDVGVSVSSTTLTVAASSPAQIIELEESGTANQWLLKVADSKYLYSATSNKLHTLDLTKEGQEITGNSKWSYSIDGSDNATITSNGANTSSNVMGYNKTSGQERFSCYGTATSHLIKIYYYHNSNPYVRHYPEELKTFQYAVGYGPSLAQALEIKGYNLTGNLTVTCPSGYELGTDANTFVASNLTLTATNNRVHTTIYIRLTAGKSVGSYNANLVISGGGITTTNVSLVGQVTADDASGEMYRAVLDAADIFPDDELVLLNDTGTWILSKEQNNNNRTAINTGFIYKGTTVYVTDAYANVQKIISEECGVNDRWLMRVGDNSYLYAPETSNRLKSATKTAVMTNHEGEWQILTDGTGVATIHTPESSPASGMKDTLNFNYVAGSDKRIFSCYNRHMKGGSVVLYYRTLPNIWCKPSSLTGFSVATAASGASDAQSFTIQAKNIATGNVTLTAPEGYEISLSENSGYTSSIILTPDGSGRVTLRTIYVHLLANSGQGTHNADITATATGATTRYVHLEGEVTPLTVTYHSASESDYVVNLSYGENAPAHDAADCDGGKVFVGWHTAEVAALQQSDPTTNATGAIANVTENKVLYAVFASPNGNTISTITDEDWHLHAWDGTNKIVSGAFSAWKTDGFEPKSYKFTASAVEYNAIVYSLSAAHTITSESAYTNLSEVRITASSRNSAAIDITVKVSTDKSSWTTVGTKSLPSASSSAPATLTYTLPSSGNYYVRIETGAYTDKDLGITDIHLYRGHANYLTDYSTTCTKAASATVTWVKNGGSSVDPSAPAVGDWLTLPVATKDNYRFDGWTATINGSEKPDVYSAGDEFLVNHAVTFTAHWTELFQVSDPATGVTSAKDQQVRSATFTMKVIGDRTITPAIDALSDGTQFAVTVGTGTNSGTSDKEWEYTFAFTPSAYKTTQGITDNATFRFKDEATGTLSAPVTISGRALPENFVIAAKWGDKWYALTSDCSSSNTYTGVVITVDNTSDPTSATAPIDTKWGLHQVASTRYADYGTGVTFVEHRTATAEDSRTTMYNYDGTHIGLSAAWNTYKNATYPIRYEWISTTTDWKDYTLTSATTLGGDAQARTISLGTDGNFGTLLEAKSYSGKVRLLPATFYEEAPVQIVEWKPSAVVVMYTGTETSATAKVGTNSETAAQTLSTRKLTHGIYELSTGSALTSNTGKTLLLTFGDTKKEFDIPWIINGSSNAVTGHDKHDVVILKNGKLTAQSTKYSFRNIYVYGGGKLKIASGTSLGVNNIILRAGGVTTSGMGSSPSATYDYVYPQVELGGTLTSTQTNIKYEYITDYDHWYQLCLPFNATLSSITYPQEYYGDNVTAANTGSWIVKRYAGEIRATGSYQAWKDIESESATEVTAGKGYIFWGAPKKVTIGGDKQRQKWGIQRMTMYVTAGAATTAETENKNISVDSYSEVATSTKPNDQGWNLVGNPYMVNLTSWSSTSLIAGKLVHTETTPWDGKWRNDGTATRYVTIPDNHFDNYVAKTAAVAVGAGDFMPGRAFFVQIAEGASTLTFSAGSRASLMPALYAKTEESVDIETGIVMSDETKQDEVNFWIKDGKTAEYEYNADYPKTPNSSNFNIYGVHSHGDLSWIAISPEIAEGSMTIGYQVPAAGEYRLSLSETYVSDKIEQLLVTDHAMNPEVTTNLMAEDYLFQVNQAETNNERFTVSIKIKSGTEITTDIDDIRGDSEHPYKFIYRDKMYIKRGDRIFDATGKMVNEIR